MGGPRRLFYAAHESYTEWDDLRDKVEGSGIQLSSEESTQKLKAMVEKDDALDLLASVYSVIGKKEPRKLAEKNFLQNTEAVPRKEIQLLAAALDAAVPGRPEMQQKPSGRSPSGV